MLSPYRVLDLTGEQGQACGKLFADLGADVVKIEPPGGDASRRRGPFVGDDPDPEKSLFWFAFNTDKRSLVLDLEDSAGRECLLQLARQTDFVLESFSPGYLDRLGLGFDALRRANPELVLVSITPFGQDGPYRDYRAPDLVAWALSGSMSIAGEAARPPAQVSDNAQTFLSACGEAAIGALIALEQRRRTGRGQHVDVSIQEAAARSVFQVSASWDMNGRDLQRGELAVPAKLPWMWRCRDGWVLWICSAGPGAARRQAGFLAWLAAIDEGRELQGMDWDNLRPAEMTGSDWERLRAPMAAVFAGRAKAELYQASIDYGFSLYPSATTAETAESTQLAAREFWREIEHPELGRTIRYPGPFAHATESPPSVRRRAPRIGEHTAEVLAEVGSLPSQARAAASTLAPATAAPLAGIKIADFSWFMVGPMTMKPFADFGADVIHVESSIRIDGQRLSGPFQGDLPDPERCGDYAQVRTGNRSIAIDLRSPQGLEIAKRLVGWADVVFDNFAAGTMQRLGLGAEDVRAINPQAIVLSCSGQGQTGPHHASKGGGGHYAALAGFNELTGWPEGEPGYLSAYTDFIAPRFNVPLLLAALDYRRRTGRGQAFDVSQYETAVHWLAPLLLDYTANGRGAGRTGNRQPDAAPHGVYRCRGDRWCAIAVGAEAEWRAFRKAIGNPAWADASAFDTLVGRKIHEDALDAHVEEWTLRHDARDVMDTLQRSDVPAGVVQTGRDLLERDPQLRHRRFYQRLDHPTLGAYHAPQHAFRLLEAPCTLRRARLIGEDTYEVLGTVLGYSDAEIERFAFARVLQ